MGRSPAISLRLKQVSNWPSDVRHPFLTKYLKHIFQDFIINEPGIRSSTTKIWINMTILATPLPRLVKKVEVDPSKFKKTLSSPPQVEIEPVVYKDIPAEMHPKITDPVLRFQSVKLSEAYGLVESRIKNLFSTAPEGQKDPSYFYQIAKNAPSSMLEMNNQAESPMEALQIYRDVPIHLKVNIITNPMLNADILAQYIARNMDRNLQPAAIYRSLLKSLEAPKDAKK